MQNKPANLEISKKKMKLQKSKLYVFKNKPANNVKITTYTSAVVNCVIAHHKQRLFVISLRRIGTG